MGTSGIKFWNKPCYTFAVKESIEAGFLCDYIIYGSGNSFDFSKYKNTKREFTKKELSDIAKQDKYVNQVNEIHKISVNDGRKKVVIICANIDHAEKVYAEISKKGSAVLIHSKIKNANDIIEEYRTNDVVYSVSIGMIQEGFDCPKIDCIAFLIPTRSSRKMTQIIGRGLRLFEGKKNCLVLDFAFVIKNCGTPRNPIVIADKKQEASKNQITQCEECFFIYEEKGPCPACGHIKVIEERDVEANLIESLNENHKSILCGRENVINNSRTIKGAQFITVHAIGVKLSLFGFNVKKFWSLVGKHGQVRITYKENGKYPKVLSLEPHRMIVI